MLIKNISSDIVASIRIDRVLYVLRPGEEKELPNRLYPQARETTKEFDHLIIEFEDDQAYEVEYDGPIPGDDVEEALNYLNQHANSRPTRKVDTFVLTDQNILDKYVVLEKQPHDPEDVELSVQYGPDQFYGSDFIMDVGNPKRCSWDSLGLDGLLEDGDRITVTYSASG